MITVSYNAYFAISKEGDNDIWTVRPRGVVLLLPLCSQIDVGATVNALLGDTFSCENNTHGSRFHDRDPQFASRILGAMTQSCYIGTCDIRSRVIRGPYCIRWMKHVSWMNTDVTRGFNQNTLLWNVLEPHYDMNLANSVFKMRTRPQTLTGKIWVGLARFPSLSYMDFGKIVLRSGKFQILFWRLQTICVWPHWSECFNAFCFYTDMLSTVSLSVINTKFMLKLLMILWNSWF